MSETITVRIIGSNNHIGCTTVGRIIAKALEQAGITDVVIDSQEGDLVTDTPAAEHNQLVAAGVSKINAAGTSVVVVDRPSDWRSYGITRPIPIGAKTGRFNAGLRELPIAAFANPMVNSLLGNAGGFYPKQLALIGYHGEPFLNEVIFAGNCKSHVTVYLSPTGPLFEQLRLQHAFHPDTKSVAIVCPISVVNNAVTQGLRSLYKYLRDDARRQDKLYVIWQEVTSPGVDALGKVEYEADIAMYTTNVHRGMTTYGISKYRSLTANCRRGSEVTVPTGSICVTPHPAATSEEAPYLSQPVITPLKMRQLAEGVTPYSLPVAWFVNPKVNALLRTPGFYISNLVIIGVHGTPIIPDFGYPASAVKATTLEMVTPVPMLPTVLFDQFTHHYRNTGGTVVTVDMRACDTTLLGTHLLSSFYRQVRQFAVEHRILVIALHHEPLANQITTQRLAMDADVCMHVSGNPKGATYEITKYRGIILGYHSLGKRVEVPAGNSVVDNPLIRFAQPDLDELTQRKGLTLGSLVLLDITDNNNLANCSYWGVLGVTGIEEVKVVNLNYGKTNRFMGVADAISAVETMANNGPQCLVVRASLWGATTSERHEYHRRLKELALRKNILILAHEDNATTLNTTPGPDCDVVVNVEVYHGEWVCKCDKNYSYGSSLTYDYVSIPTRA